MIKATAGNLLVLGLSARNLELLRAGKPIAFDLAPLATGVPLERVCIFFGETEAAMRATLAEFIGPDTVVSESEAYRTGPAP